MNELVSDFYREELLAGLKQCSDREQDLFRRIYDPKSAPGAPIEETVQKMPESKLDWALEQVQNTLRKKEKR